MYFSLFPRNSVPSYATNKELSQAFHKQCKVPRLKMLAAEDKRWLVVGICLSKVLTPVIRTVLKHEMQQLYQALTVPPHNIHSQTFACHATHISPSTLTLNYASINDNVLKGSHYKYDYSVKDYVSLAKLFVKPFMASFTGFDGSLDLSAALSILCWAPNFVFQAVDIIATEVRSVRNEWGHCKSSNWTEAYYLDCFSLMEKLIKRLNLPATLDQANILEELETWRKTGEKILIYVPLPIRHCGKYRSESLSIYVYCTLTLYTLLISNQVLQKRVCSQLAKANLGGPCLNNRITKVY